MHSILRVNNMHILNTRKLLYGIMREVTIELKIKGNRKIKFQDFFSYLTDKIIDLGHLPKEIKTDEKLIDKYDLLYSKASTYWENQLERK